MRTLIAFAAFVAIAVATRTCPKGGEVYEYGISEAGKKDVLIEHNKYRKAVLDGKVPNQPRGTNIKIMDYDEKLGAAAKVVSDSCQLKHIPAKDDRWKWIGQNLYVEYSSHKSEGQNWTAAVESWFNEHKNFVYPITKLNGDLTGHYTQVVWAESDHLGCDFTFFYNKDDATMPYTKLYTCNYGPGGNVNNKAPYKLY